MNKPTFETVTSAPRLERGRPVFDTTAWTRLPTPGARCQISSLARTSLAELVTPCARNDYRPPVEARVLRRPGAKRGIVLISRASLIDYINKLPAPSTSRAKNAQ